MCPDAEAGQQVEGGPGARSPEDKERSSWGRAGEVGCGQTVQSSVVLWEVLEGE